jgi:membrane-anchored glycerophosphoryl diester phosphodiesterase (GDPDase)
MNDTAAPASLPPSIPIPMTFGQILDRIYRLMRANFKLFIGIAAVPAGVMIPITALFFAIAFVPVIAHPQSPPNPGAVFGLMVPAILVTMLLSLVVFALYLAASIHAASQAHLGLKITFGEAYAVAWKRCGRYLWLMFLGYLIACAPILVAELVIAVPMGLLSMNKATPPPVFFLMIPLVMLLFIGAIVYGVIMAMRLSLAFPASIAEDLTAWAAIRRSGQLTQGAKGRIFLVFLVIYALAYAAEMVVGIVLMVVLMVGALIVAALHIQLASVVGVIGAGVAAVFLLGFLFLWMALIWSAFSTAFAVIYHDQRLRIDGPPPAPLPAGVPA